MPGCRLCLLAVALLGARPAAAQLPSVVEIRVVSPASGEPIPGAWVEVVGGDRGDRAGSDGRLRITGLVPGRHRLRASHPGYRPAEVEAEAANGRTTRLEILLSPDPVVLDEIRVEGGRARDGAGGTVLRPEDAGARIRTLADLVETAPGVVVIRRGGPGAPVVPTIRGSAGDQVLVLVDGMAINAPLTGEADLSIVDLSSVERVVVLPGASSARYGAGALAGVILVETATPSTAGGRVLLNGGSFGEMGIDGTASLPVGPGPARQGSALQGTGRPAPAWTVDGGLRFDRARGDFPYPVPEVRGGGTTRRGNASHTHLRGHLALLREGPLLRARLRLHGSDLERGSPGTVVQPSGTGSQEQTRLGGTGMVEGGSPGRGWRATGGLESHAATFLDPSPPFGGSYHERSRVRQGGAAAELWDREGPVELQGGVDVRTRELSATSLDQGAPRRVREGGGWIEGSWSAGSPEGPGARVTGGLRGDRHTLISGVVFSPSMALELSREGTRMRLRTARGFSPPGLADLFFQEGVLARANPDLGPERVKGEVTGELAQKVPLPAGRGELRLSAFRADVRGMILWFPDHRFVWRPENFDVNRHGGALTMDGRWPGYRLGIRVGGEWSRVTYTGRVLSGQVVYRPSWTASLAADWAPGPVQLDGELRHHGERRTVPGSSLNALAPFTTLDTGVRAPLPLPLGSSALAAEGELAVRNAFDARASFLADYPLPGRSWAITLRLTRHR
jgi:vitamin B12 transporter